MLTTIVKYIICFDPSKGTTYYDYNSNKTGLNIPYSFKYFNKIIVKKITKIANNMLDNKYDKTLSINLNYNYYGNNIIINVQDLEYYIPNGIKKEKFEYKITMKECYDALFNFYNSQLKIMSFIKTLNILFNKKYKDESKSKEEKKHYVGYTDIEEIHIDILNYHYKELYIAKKYKERLHTTYIEQKWNKNKFKNGNKYTIKFILSMRLSMLWRNYKMRKNIMEIIKKYKKKKYYENILKYRYGTFRFIFF